MPTTYTQHAGVHLAYFGAPEYLLSGPVHTRPTRHAQTHTQTPTWDMFWRRSFFIWTCFNFRSSALLGGGPGRSSEPPLPVFEPSFLFVDTTRSSSALLPLHEV